MIIAEVPTSVGAVNEIATDVVLLTALREVGAVLGTDNVVNEVMLEVAIPTELVALNCT